MSSMDVNDLRRITAFLEAIQEAAANEGVELYADQKLSCSVGGNTWAEVRVVDDRTKEEVDAGLWAWHLELVT